MGKKHKKAPKGETHTASEPEELAKAPHTFVISRGRLGKNTGELMFNFRKIMEPFTATRLKVQKRNTVRDFVSVAGLLNVTHMVVFTKTEAGVYMRIIRLPRGPTLTFLVENYSLMRDVLSSLKKPITYAHQFANHPLLVLNNFSGEGMHLKLMTSMFQNMFPSINVQKVKLGTIRRCLLLNYCNDTNTISLRHYTIKVAPSDVSKAVKKIVQSKVPNLGQLQDISEYVEYANLLSEGEEGTQVVAPQRLPSRGTMPNEKSSVRLVELGPRMTLKLIKIESGIMEGEVLYHMLVHKSKKEIEMLRKRKEAKQKLKEQRKLQQEENRLKKLPQEPEEANISDEDREWYRREVGQEPDEDVLPARKVVKKVHKEDDQPQEEKKAVSGDFQIMMKRRKQRRKLKEKMRTQKTASKKVARFRALTGPAVNRKTKRKHKK